MLNKKQQQQKKAFGGKTFFTQKLLTKYYKEMPNNAFN